MCVYVLVRRTSIPCLRVEKNGRGVETRATLIIRGVESVTYGAPGKDEGKPKATARPRVRHIGRDGGGERSVLGAQTLSSLL